MDDADILSDFLLRILKAAGHWDFQAIADVAGELRTWAWISSGESAARWDEGHGD